MAAAAAVSMAHAVPSWPVTARVVQSMRPHSMGKERSQRRTGNGQDPGADRVVVGGSGGGGLALQARWNPCGWALASETKWTVSDPDVT